MALDTVDHLGEGYVMKRDENRWVVANEHGDRYEEISHVEWEKKLVK